MAVTDNTKSDASAKTPTPGADSIEIDTDRDDAWT